MSKYINIRKLISNILVISILASFLTAGDSLCAIADSSDSVYENFEHSVNFFEDTIFWSDCTTQEITTNNAVSGNKSFYVESGNDWATLIGLSAQEYSFAPSTFYHFSVTYRVEAPNDFNMQFVLADKRYARFNVQGASMWEGDESLTKNAKFTSIDNAQRLDLYFLTDGSGDETWFKLQACWANGGIKVYIDNVVIEPVYKEGMTISHENLIFGIDEETGLGKLYNNETGEIWEQYYASPTVGTANIPLEFDDTSAWTITKGTIIQGESSEVAFNIGGLNENGKLTSVFPGEKIHSGNYQLKVRYRTENAASFSLSAQVLLWRNNINTANNADWWLNTVSGDTQTFTGTVNNGVHEYIVDIPQSAFREHTGQCSIDITITKGDNGNGNVIIQSAELVGCANSTPTVIVSNVNISNNKITLNVNNSTRDAKGSSAVACTISFDENGALKYDFKMSYMSRSFAETLEYPPTFYNNSDTMQWLLPKDSGLLLNATDLDSYTNKKLKINDFYCASGLDMAFYAGVDSEKNSSYLAIIDTPINAGVLYPQTQIGKKQGFLPIISFFGDKEKWKENRSVRFVFMNSGSYVDVAKAYREIAKEKGYVKTYEEKEADNPNLTKTALAHRIQLGIFLEDAPEFFERMNASGIKNYLVRVSDLRDPLNTQAYYETQELIDSGFFSETLEKYPDVMFYEYLNPRDVYLTSGEFEVDEDFADFAEPYLLKGSTGNYLTGWTDITGVSAYIACPSIYSKYIEYRMNRYPQSTYPITTRFIDILATCSLGEGQCYDYKHYMDRTSTYNAKIKILQDVLALGNDVQTEGAAEYMVPYASAFEGSLGFMNLSGMYSHTDMLDKENGTSALTERVPLWQLVFHDCAGTSWHWEFGGSYPELNKYCDLFNLLYAERGIFLPYWQQTNLSDFYFQDMLDRMERLNTVLYKVGTDDMVNHLFLTQDGTVQQTVFKSGVSVTVNFGEQAYWNGSEWIDSMDYCISDNSHIDYDYRPKEIHEDFSNAENLAEDTVFWTDVEKQTISANAYGEKTLVLESLKSAEKVLLALNAHDYRLLPDTKYKVTFTYSSDSDISEMSFKLNNGRYVTWSGLNYAVKGNDTELTDNIQFVIDEENKLNTVTVVFSTSDLQEEDCFKIVAYCEALQRIVFTNIDLIRIDDQGILADFENVSALSETAYLSDAPTCRVAANNALFGNKGLIVGNSTAVNNLNLLYLNTSKNSLLPDTDYCFTFTYKITNSAFMNSLKFVLDDGRYVIFNCTSLDCTDGSSELIKNTHFSLNENGSVTVSISFSNPKFNFSKGFKLQGGINQTTRMVISFDDIFLISLEDFIADKYVSSSDYVLSLRSLDGIEEVGIECISDERYNEISFKNLGNNSDKRAHYVNYLDSYYCIDFDNDGYVSATDLVSLRKSLLGVIGLENVWDITSDKCVDIIDLVRLKKILSIESATNRFDNMPGNYIYPFANKDVIKDNELLTCVLSPYFVLKGKRIYSLYL